MNYGSDSTGAQPGQQAAQEKKQTTNTPAPIGDGGPAFARPVSRYAPADGPCDFYDAQAGMSLRDYFAAKAMAALIALDCGHKDAANEAYHVADAMIERRKAVRP